MSVIEGCDGTRASWPQIHDYIMGVAARPVAVYSYLIAPHGLEATTRRVIHDIGADDLFTVLNEGEALPQHCHQVVVLEPPEKTSYWWRMTRWLAPTRAFA